MFSLHFALNKMTTPLKLAVNEDCVELEKIGDHVSDGMLLFTPDLAKYCSNEAIVSYD